MVVPEVKALVEAAKDRDALRAVAVELAGAFEEADGADKATISRELRLVLERLEGTNTGTSRIDDLKERRDRRRSGTG
jgi:hypothetical protein